MHRDLARLRPSQQTEQQPQNASPTNSLDSDTVMVEVPSQDQTVNNGAPAQTQGSTQSLSVQAGGLSASTWKQPAAPAITTTQPEHDIEAHRQFAYSQQQPLHKIDAPEQPASNTAASHEDQSKLRADTPRPSTETMQASDDQANDVTNELADTDFRTLLPGIEDFANGSGGVAGDGMNLDELTSENLFGDDPVNTLQGTDEGRGAGSGDFFDDDGITSEGVPGNFSNQTSQFDFSDMNFRGLVPSGGAGNDGNQGANANFDFLNLEDDFWNLTGSNDAH